MGELHEVKSPCNSSPSSKEEVTSPCSQLCAPTLSLVDSDSRVNIAIRAPSFVSFQLRSPRKVAANSQLVKGKRGM